MYDVVVVGRDLSSLIAALASARSGRKTVLVNEGKLQIEHRESGYVFPMDPTPFWGFGEGQIINRLIEDLKLTQDSLPPPLVLDPALQVIFSEHRFDLFQDLDRLILDMTREFPQREREIRRFYHVVSKAEILIKRWISEDHDPQSRNLKKLSGRLCSLPLVIANRSSFNRRVNKSDQIFRKVIEAQYTLLSHLNCSHNLFPLSLGYLLALPQRGFYYPYGRISWMTWLYKEFTDAGGILMNDCSVMRIDTSPEIIIDMESAGTPLTIRGTKLIASTQWEKLKLLLLHQKVFRRVAHKLDSFRPQLYPFSLHLGVHTGGLPESLSPYAVVVRDENMSATDSNLVFILSTHSGDTSYAPEGKKAITTTVYLKESPLILSDLELKGIANSIIDSLDRFLPFLRESIDFVNIEKSIELSRQAQDIVCQKYRPRRWTIMGLDTFSPKTSLHNVLMTGGIFRAGLGFEGEILAGLDAAILTGTEIRRHER